MPASKNSRMLVATQYHGLLDLIRPVARELGFSVTHATDGDAAIARLKEQSDYGLILADWALEPKGGLALAHRVRKNASMKFLRLLFMSTTVTKDMIDEARWAGADGFIRKPFSISTLQRKIVSVLAEADEAREMLARACACAWNGCAQTYAGPELPQGWRHLLMCDTVEPSPAGAGPAPGRRDRDALLCPEHADALDQLIKPGMR